MKIRYFQSGKVRKAKRAERKRVRDQKHKERIAKWHSKFVIWPRILHTPDDSAEYATRACFERVMQKGRIVNNIHGMEITVWTRHTEKDYFVKKLDGTLEPEEDFSHDGVDMNMGATQGPTSSGPSGPVSYG